MQFTPQYIHPRVAAATSQARYCCFDRYGADTMAYAFAVGCSPAPVCSWHVASSHPLAA
jgi:hypothetical protein